MLQGYADSLQIFLIKDLLCRVGGRYLQLRAITNHDYGTNAEQHMGYTLCTVTTSLESVSGSSAGNSSNLNSTRY